MIAWTLLFLLAAASGEPGELDSNWNRYLEVFRPPNEIRFELNLARPDPNENLLLKRVAERLRSYPQLEEAFALDPCQDQREEMTVFLLLNSSPIEFGAWIERLKPHLVREQFRGYRKQAKPPEDECNKNCERPDPLCLRNFHAANLPMPLFKQPLPGAIFVRLKAPADAPRTPEYWDEQGRRMEQRIRSAYDELGYSDVTVQRRQYLPLLGPRAESSLIAVCAAAALFGTCLFALFHRTFAPWLGLLFATGLVLVCMQRFAETMAGFFDPRVLPTGAAIALFWGTRAFGLCRHGQPQQARAAIFRRALLALAAGGAAALLIKFSGGAPVREAGLLLVVLPLGAAALLALTIFGWGSEVPREYDAERAADFLERSLLAWRNFLVCVAVLGLSGFLIWHALGRAAPTIPVRQERPGPWQLAADHSISEDTFCLLTEAPGPGEMLYQLGAQKFAFGAAGRERLVTRYWDPSAWVPKPGWQQSNARDFLKKRNAVVLEKIAKQEGITEEELAPTLEFLNHIGQMALPLSTGEIPEWDMTMQQDSLGFRLRQWLRMREGGQSVALAYGRPLPRTPIETLMPWIEAGMKPFGVQPRFVVPEIIQQVRLRALLIEMAIVGAAAGLFLVLGSRVERACGLPRAAVSTFLFLASWFLTWIALGVPWNAQLMWVWSAVIVFHAVLTLEWLPRLKPASWPGSPIPASLLAAGIFAITYGFWSYGGPAQSVAGAATAGFLWSIAWTALLFAGKRSGLADPGDSQKGGAT